MGRNATNKKRNKTPKIYIADTETTVYDGQTSTEVWASAITPLKPAGEEYFEDEVLIHHSLPETLRYLENLKTSVTVYYHNLKFDGEFIVYQLLNSDLYQYPILPGPRDMEPCSWGQMTSGMGTWYKIVIKTRYNKTITILDSLKLLPFSVRELGNAFNTQHRKKDMEYTGFRYAGCPISAEERSYIANDVLVVAECMQIMFAQGLTKMTIGSNCMDDFKHTVEPLLGDCTSRWANGWKKHYPDLVEMDSCLEGVSADAYIRKAYHGGWCYVNPKIQGQELGAGCVADVNSLYPSVMHSQSGSVYPYGKPTFWTGSTPAGIIKLWKRRKAYYFVRIKCRFEIKKDHLPFIQIKGNPFYKKNEMLTSSAPTETLGGKKLRGKKWSTVELTLTCYDYELFHEHYNVYDEVILDGCWFKAEKGIFDTYINKHAKEKMTQKGALRTLAKLKLNNIYGKFATSPEADYKTAYLKPDGSVGYTTSEDPEGKSAGFIAVGAAITSYARNFTIRTAQKNYEHFCYADTDSIHCTCSPDELIDVPIHETAFCCWKIENEFDTAIFARQKTYIEITGGNYNIKCAGMTDTCKENLTAMFYAGMPLTDFKPGLQVPGKLTPKHIPGGVLLVDSMFTMKTHGQL